jgi:hypothetical protein
MEIALRFGHVLFFAPQADPRLTLRATTTRSTRSKMRPFYRQPPARPGSRAAFVLHHRRRCAGPPFVPSKVPPSCVPSASRQRLWCSRVWVRLQPVCLVVAWYGFAVALRRTSSGNFYWSQTNTEVLRTKFVIAYCLLPIYCSRFSFVQHLEFGMAQSPFSSHFRPPALHKGHFTALRQLASSPPRHWLKCCFALKPRPSHHVHVTSSPRRHFVTTPPSKNATSYFVTSSPRRHGGHNFKSSQLYGPLLGGKHWSSAY